MPRSPAIFDRTLSEAFFRELPARPGETLSFASWRETGTALIIAINTNDRIIECTQNFGGAGRVGVTDLNTNKSRFRLFVAPTILPPVPLPLPRPWEPPEILSRQFLAAIMMLTARHFRPVADPAKPPFRYPPSGPKSAPGF